MFHQKLYIMSAIMLMGDRDGFHLTVSTGKPKRYWLSRFMRWKQISPDAQRVLRNSNLPICEEDSLIEEHPIIILMGSTFKKGERYTTNINYVARRDEHKVPKIEDAVAIKGATLNVHLDIMGVDRIIVVTEGIYEPRNTFERHPLLCIEKGEGGKFGKTKLTAVYHDETVDWPERTGFAFLKKK